MSFYFMGDIPVPKDEEIQRMLLRDYYMYDPVIIQEIVKYRRLFIEEDVSGFLNKTMPSYLYSTENEETVPKVRIAEAVVEKISNLEIKGMDRIGRNIERIQDENVEIEDNEADYIDVETVDSKDLAKEIIVVEYNIQPYVGDKDMPIKNIAEKNIVIKHTETNNIKKEKNIRVEGISKEKIVKKVRFEDIERNKNIRVEGISKEKIVKKVRFEDIEMNKNIRVKDITKKNHVGQRIKKKVLNLKIEKKRPMPKDDVLMAIRELFCPVCSACCKNIHSIVYFEKEETLNGKNVYMACVKCASVVYALKHSRKSYIERLKIEQDQVECVLCLLDFETGQEVRRTTCGHVYHKDCSEKWFKYNDFCFKCPTRLMKNRPMFYSIVKRSKRKYTITLDMWRKTYNTLGG